MASQEMIDRVHNTTPEACKHVLAYLAGSLPDAELQAAFDYLDETGWKV